MAAIAGRPSSPMRSLRPLPSTRISPRPRSRFEQLRGRQLADPQAGRVRDLDQRPITLRDRARDRRGAPAPSRSPAVGSLVLVDRREQPLDLVDLEDARQASRQARRGDRAPRVAGGQARARGEAMERADRGEPLAHRRARPRANELREVGAQVAACRRSPVGAALREPVQVRRRRRSRRSGACAPTRPLRAGSGGSDPAASRVSPRAEATPRRRVGVRSSPPSASFGRRVAGPASRRSPRPRHRPTAARPSAGPACRRECRRDRAARRAAAARSASPRPAPRSARRHFRHRNDLAERRHRAVVRVVERADRLVIRRVVALRVVRAPPEDVAGAPRATRHELAVGVLRADRPRTGAAAAAPGPRA